MLTAITLQNFKGVRDPMRVPIKPITLLFGANSIGKSTIVQAIHYAREILERQNLDPDKTLSGGSAVDLGGFHSLVHNHDPENKIILRFDLDLSETDLPTYRYYLLEDAPFDWSSWAQSAWVELIVQWSHSLKRPVLISYQTALNGVPIAKIETALDEANVVVAYNSKHHIYSSYIAGLEEGNEEKPEPTEDGMEDAVQWENVTVQNTPSSVPRWGELLIVNDETSPEGYVPEHFSVDISQTLVGPGELLRDLLRRLRYLGPLRRTLPRNHRRALTEDESLWADGTAAWDVLSQSSQDFINEVNTWLADAKRLDTGYSVRLDRFRAIPADSPLLTELFIALRDETFFENYDLSYFESERDRHEIREHLAVIDEAKNLEVQPYDIGVGISQVIPVVVAALDTRQGIVAVEQPELHLHPAVQAELGDLFIESALGPRSNTVLIETHSEHLILRMLRRIRESSANKNIATQTITPDNISLLFVGNRQTGTSIQPLRIDKRGRIIDRIPGGFFEEDFAELF
ncbi:MAG TPA: AAA family ATPase [Pyrinomonadaceae bacterium]|jgi:hypothetical protein